MEEFMSGVESIQAQMAQANEALLVEISLNAASQALVDSVNTAREQGLEGQEAYNHIVASLAAVQTAEG